MKAKIEIAEMPKMYFAYVSNIGAKNLKNAYGKLIQWATPQGLMRDQTKTVTI